MDSEHSSETTDNDTRAETHISAELSQELSRAVWPREAGHSGSMGLGPLFPCVACNELSQPLLGSLTEAARQNGSPSWQSGQADRCTHCESLIRAWPRPVQLVQALSTRLTWRPSPPCLLEARVSRGCLGLPFDPGANQC